MKTIRDQLIELGLIKPKQKPSQDLAGLRNEASGETSYRKAQNEHSSHAQRKLILIPQAKPYLDKDGNVSCVLCQLVIPYGELAKHMEVVHDISKLRWEELNKAYRPSGNSWIPVFQGGLPSLGKRSR